MGVPNYDYSGCRVLVTDGGHGLGHRVAHAFARSGADVQITGTAPFVATYDADLTAFTYHRADLTDGDSIAELAAAVGPVDVLVNQAAPSVHPDLEGGELEFLSHAARLGLIGPFQLATRLRLRLANSTSRGGGSVINLPSIERWFELAYGAAPATEPEASTRRLGRSWARAGVRVNTILTAALVPAQRPAMRVSIEPGSGPLLTRSRLVTRSSLQREIVDLTLFLGSSGAAGLTGQTLLVGDAPA